MSKGSGRRPVTDPALTDDGFARRWALAFGRCDEHDRLLPCLPCRVRGWGCVTDDHDSPRARAEQGEGEAL